MDMHLLTPTFWLLFAGSVLTLLLAIWRARQARLQHITVRQRRNTGR